MMESESQIRNELLLKLKTIAAAEASLEKHVFVLDECLSIEELKNKISHLEKKQEIIDPLKNLIGKLCEQIGPLNHLKTTLGKKMKDKFLNNMNKLKMEVEKKRISEFSYQTKSTNYNNVDSLKNINFKIPPSIDVNNFNCLVALERCPLLPRHVEFLKSLNQNYESTSGHNQPVEVVNDDIEKKSLNGIFNFNSIDNKIDHENKILKAIKLNCLSNQDNKTKRLKKKKYQKKKKLKTLKCVSIIETPMSNMQITCENNEYKSNFVSDNRINDLISTSSYELLHNDNESISTAQIDDEEYTFKGFSPTDIVPNNKYEILKDLIKIVQNEDSQHQIENDGFRGFTPADLFPCKKLHIVKAQLIKLKESKGLPDEELEFKIIVKFIEQHPILSKQLNMNEKLSIIYNGNGKFY